MFAALTGRWATTRWFSWRTDNWIAATGDGGRPDVAVVIAYR